MNVQWGPQARAWVERLDCLAAALASEPRLADTIVVRPHPLIVLAHRATRLVVLAPALLWDYGRQLLSPYWPRFQAGNAMLLLMGNVLEPNLEAAVNQGLAALLDTEPSVQSVYVALQNAFASMDRLAQCQSRDRSIDRFRYELGELVEIARAMTTERDIDKLLGLILEKARFVTGADAGSIYVVEGDDPDLSRRVLRFKLTQNDSVQFDWSEFTLPISARSISGLTALERKTINIADVYDLPPGSRFAVDRSFDNKIGYRTKSMLCVPLVDKDGGVIGVLQLINKKREPRRRLLQPEDFEQQVIAFDDRSQQLLEALAAQAGLSLENALLYEEIRHIFEGFVRASVEAIEQRDPTTSGHSRRVAELALGLAQALQRTDTGPYRDVHFTAQDLRELEYASLLHDFGKIGVREQVLVKAKKLYPADLELIRARFDVARAAYESDCLRRKLEALHRGADHRVVEELDYELERLCEQLRLAWQSIEASNEPTVLHQEHAWRIDDIAKLRVRRPDGTFEPLLRDDEIANLKIARGSLNSREIDEIRSHVVHTYRFLQRIPWGRSFQRIPQIASAHHERLNGTGYPRGLRAEHIPLQSKIMSVADIFDALTANDRPYKAAVPIDRALDILHAEARDAHVDGELVRIFCDSRPWTQLR